MNRMKQDESEALIRQESEDIQDEEEEDIEKEPDLNTDNINVPGSRSPGSERILRRKDLRNESMDSTQSLNQTKVETHRIPTRQISFIIVNFQ